ncbi:hypothetical protein BKA70DRAFT_1251282 [Coprinopsis sp. MPI-PUGE-AT-0042]|nr:hypothetical protein BKA70DRAFT_1251282 [Coprinopsis sp. MPI-PUGE-AT-0042]
MSSSPIQQLRALNTTQELPKSFPYTLHVAPNTDIFRKPPSMLPKSQPTLYIETTCQKFQKATVKIKSIAYEHLYDHAGLIFIWADQPDTWIKMGVEFCEGELMKACVAPGMGGWSDFSLGGPVKSTTDVVVTATRKDATLLIEVDGVMVRQIKGAFTDDNLDKTLWVGIFGARPANVEGSMNVEFDDFKIELDNSL